MRAQYFMRLLVAAFGGGLLGLGGGPSPCPAQVFTIDTNQSSITISGTAAGGTITPQSPGSLTTKIGGTLNATLVGNTIQFTNQSQILAQTNGSWQPKADGTTGSEPADFGGQASLAGGLASGFAALRNIQLDCTSPPISINAGQFNSTNVTFLFPSNSLSALAYNVSGFINTHGSIALTGYATNKVTSLGSLTTVGSQQTLTIPVNATFTFKLISANDTMITLQGQLVAVHGTQAPFQVQTVAVKNQQLLLTVQAAAGQQIQVQSSTNLTKWQTNATVVIPASGSYTYTGAVTGPVGFYRLAK